MNWALYGIRSTQNTSIYIYIYIYIYIILLPQKQFFEWFWVRRLIIILLLDAVNGQLKILQNHSKNRFEAKGRQYTTSKVIQLLFNIDLNTYLAIYRYRWSKRYIQYIYFQITIGYTHRLCGRPVKKPTTKICYIREKISRLWLANIRAMQFLGNMVQKKGNWVQKSVTNVTFWLADKQRNSLGANQMRHLNGAKFGSAPKNRNGWRLQHICFCDRKNCRGAEKLL